MLFIIIAVSKKWREVTHFWYSWPENGVPSEEASITALLLEAKSLLKSTMIEQDVSLSYNVATNNVESANKNHEVSSLSINNKNKSLQRNQG